MAEVLEMCALIWSPSDGKDDNLEKGFGWLPYHPAIMDIMFMLVKEDGDKAKFSCETQSPPHDSLRASWDDITAGVIGHIQVGVTWREYPSKNHRQMFSEHIVKLATTAITNAVHGIPTSQDHY